MESGGPPRADRWSRRATVMLFAVIALPVAAYFAGNWYETPDVGSASTPPIVPLSADDWGYLLTFFLLFFVLSSLASLALTAAAVRLGVTLGARVNRMTAGFTPIGLILGMAALTIALYIIGYFVGALWPVTEHSC